MPLEIMIKTDSFLCTALTFVAIACMSPSSMAQSKPDSGSKNDGNSALIIRHDKVRAVDLNCSAHQVAGAKAATPGGQLDQEKLILAAVKDKPFPKPLLQSLGWMELALRTYGFQGSLTTLKGPSQMAAMRLASLADNDYTIAAQMAYGVHMRQGLIPASHGEAIGRFIMSLTESSDQTPENNNSNLMVEKASVLLEGSSAPVKAYGRWAIRAYAYDDMVAADAAVAGVCMSNPKSAEIEALRKAIKYAQYNPKRDYTQKPPDLK
jgi:hypothetical protein